MKNRGTQAALAFFLLGVVADHSFLILKSEFFIIKL